MGSTKIYIVDFYHFLNYSGANIQEWMGDEQVAEYNANGEQFFWNN